MNYARPRNKGIPVLCAGSHGPSAERYAKVLAFGASKRSATSRARTSCRESVRQQFVLDWSMPSRTRQQRGVPKTWRLPFWQRRANDLAARLRSRRETHAPGAPLRTHSKLEPGVCPMIGEGCTSSAFCLAGKTMTSKLPSLGGLSFRFNARAAGDHASCYLVLNRRGEAPASIRSMLR
jgi:hypothetical protein